MAAAVADQHDDRWLILRSLRMSGDRMSIWLSGLNSLGFETYYPMIRELRPVPRRKLSHHQRSSNVSIMRPSVVPFLPSLVFVRGRGRASRVIDDGSKWGRLMSADMALVDLPGVVGFVAAGTDPVLISDVMIARLRARAAAGEDGAIPGATPAEYIFRIGERVQIVHGAFTAFPAKIEELPDVPIERIDADTRLRLTIDIFGRQTPVSVAVADVRKF